MSSNGEGEQRELGDYLSLLLRRWPWILVPTIVVATLAWFYSTSRPLSYEATARVLLDTTAAQDAVASRINVNTDVASRDLVNEINLAQSDVVRQEVADRLTLRLDDLPESDITADIDSDVLNFELRQPSPRSAALVANTWANVYVDHKREVAQESISAILSQLEIELVNLRMERTTIREQLEELEDQLVATTNQSRREVLQLRIDREASAISGEISLVDAQIEATVESITQLQLSRELAGSAQILQAAAEPLKPANAPVSRDVAIGAFLGLILGAGVALGRDSMDRTIKGSESVEALGATILGEVPRIPRKLAGTGPTPIAQRMPGGVYADAYQKIRSAVRFVSLNEDIKTILVTSPHEGDGKTTLTVNLATAFSAVGTRTILLDLDLRRPSVHQHFSAKAVPGFADTLMDSTSLAEVSVEMTGRSGMLRVLPAGTCPADPAAFLGSPGFGTVIASLRADAEVLLIDTPPILSVADALSIMSVVDGVILVVRAGRTTAEELVEAVQELRRAGGNLLGVVVNRVTPAKSSPYYDLTDDRTTVLGSSAADFDSSPTAPVQPPPDTDQKPSVPDQADWKPAVHELGVFGSGESRRGFTTDEAAPKTPAVSHQPVGDEAETRPLVVDMEAEGMAGHAVSDSDLSPKATMNGSENGHGGAPEPTMTWDPGSRLHGESEVEPDVGEQPEVEPDAGEQPELEPDAESDADVDIDDSDANVDIDSDRDVDTDSDANAESDNDASSDRESESDLVLELDSEGESSSVAEEEPNLELDLESVNADFGGIDPTATTEIDRSEIDKLLDDLF